MDFLKLPYACDGVVHRRIFVAYVTTIGNERPNFAKSGASIVFLFTSLDALHCFVSYRSRPPLFNSHSIKFICART